MAKYDDWLTDEGLLKIEGWARDGLTNEQIAFNMGVARQTLNDWSKRFPVISDTLKRGKEVVDRKVENALYKNAIGYRYDEITKELSDSGELVVTKVVTKEVKPDTTAQIFWLKNRKPEMWRDRQQVEHSGETTHHIKNDNDLSKLSVEELKELESILSKATDTD